MNMEEQISSITTNIEQGSEAEANTQDRNEENASITITPENENINGSNDDVRIIEY